MEITKEMLDYTHDVFTDLIISCMRSGHIPSEEPQIGDWCIEVSHFNIDKNRDECIGKLVNVEDDKYTIETIGGKIVNWSNAELRKIPSKHMRK
jgi:hypothetical protein